MLRKGAIFVGGTAAVAAAVLYRSRDSEDFSHLPWSDIRASPAPRRDQIGELQRSKFDLLIIGGGAVGAGCAVDASTRGLKVAMVEQEDWGSGTSSRSTKLIHGGVRYLEKAVFQLDYGQLKLVFEALNERKTMIQNSRHLADLLPILTPCYNFYEVPYYWAGMKAYDLLAYASNSGLALSRFMPSSEAKRLFPTLAKSGPDGKTLKGTVLYYDGQFDDTRMNISLVSTSTLAGAAVSNYTRVIAFTKDEDGKLNGARVKDLISGREFNIQAKVVLNATGIHSDNIRMLSDKGRPNMVTASEGVHVTLPDYYSPSSTGLIVPKTKDGRVVFMLPWLGATIAGTTDSPGEVTMTPRASEKDLDFILEAISDYVTVQVRKEDVLSVWSGLRCLATDPTQEQSTENVCRDHVVVEEDDGLITCTAGKWTTYRKMAQDAVDAVMEAGGFSGAPCVTENLPVVGAIGWRPDLFTEVAQNYIVPHRPGAIDTKVAEHLVRSYGDRAIRITRIAEEKKLGRRLVRGYPQLEAEVVYCCENEFCTTPMDFLARRTRLAFLDVRATREALPKVVELMAQSLGWGYWRRTREYRKALAELKNFECAES